MVKEGGRGGGNGGERECDEELTSNGWSVSFGEFVCPEPLYDGGLAHLGLAHYGHCADQGRAALVIQTLHRQSGGQEQFLYLQNVH